MNFVVLYLVILFKVFFYNINDDTLIIIKICNIFVIHTVSSYIKKSFFYIRIMKRHYIDYILFENIIDYYHRKIYNETL